TWPGPKHLSRRPLPGPAHAAAPGAPLYDRSGGGEATRPGSKRPEGKAGLVTGTGRGIARCCPALPPRGSGPVQGQRVATRFAGYRPVKRSVPHCRAGVAVSEEPALVVRGSVPRSRGHAVRSALTD